MNYSIALSRFIQSILCSDFVEKNQKSSKIGPIFSSVVMVIILDGNFNGRSDFTRFINRKKYKKFFPNKT